MPHSAAGPMARRAADVALMAALMAGREPRDPSAWPVPFDTVAARGGIAGLRVALAPTLGTGVPSDDDVRAALADAAAAVASAGAIVEEDEPQWPSDPHDAFIVLCEATMAGFLTSIRPRSRR